MQCDEEATPASKRVWPGLGHFLEVSVRDMHGDGQQAGGGGDIHITPPAPCISTTRRPPSALAMSHAWGGGAKGPSFWCGRQPGRQGLRNFISDDDTDLWMHALQSPRQGVYWGGAWEAGST